jgi:hypothetical protein
MKWLGLLLIALLSPAFAQNSGSITGGPQFNVVSPLNGQCFAYNLATNTWINTSLCNGGGGGSTPGGTNGQLQYNNNGVFGGTTNLPSGTLGNDGSPLLDTTNTAAVSNKTIISPNFTDIGNTIYAIPGSQFYGSISGTTLTVSNVISGTIAIGQVLTGYPGSSPSAGTAITGGSGLSWTVNNSQTIGPVILWGAGASVTASAQNKLPGLVIWSALNAGTDQNNGNGYLPNQLEITLGTASVPITNGSTGSNVKISRTESYTTGACTSSLAAECNSGLEVVTVGSATDYMQGSGIYAASITTSPTSPGAVGITAVGVDNANGGASGDYGTGAFLVGMMGGDGSTGATGTEIRAVNNSSIDCSANYNSVYRCDGIWLSTSGAHKLGSAIQTATNASWIEGVTLNNGSVLNVGFNDQSSSTTAFQAGANHTTAWSSPNFSVSGTGVVASSAGNNWSGLNTFTQNNTNFGDPGIIVNNSAAGAVVPVATFFAPNMTAGQQVSFVLGKQLSSDNYASFNYTWNGNGFSSNKLGIGVYTANDLVDIYEDGGLTIGAPTGGDKGSGTLNSSSGVYDNGTRVSANLSGTTGSIGGSALLAGQCSTGTVSITGATTGMAVVATPVTYPTAGNFWQSYVSSAGTVTVAVCAAVADTPTATTYNVRVLQ